MTPNINYLLDKYWEGETSLEEEITLKSYFESVNVADEHTPYRDLFGWMSDQSNICTELALDTDTLLNKYWEGETTIKEEKILKAYFESGQISENHLPFAELFGYFNDRKSLNYPPLTESKEDGLGAKMFTLRKLVYAIAAVFLLVIGAITAMQLMDEQSAGNKSAMVNEIEDPEEALRVTKEALALVSSKFRASQESVRENMGALEKAAIFK